MCRHVLYHLFSVLPPEREDIIDCSRANTISLIYRPHHDVPKPPATARIRNAAMVERSDRLPSISFVLSVTPGRHDGMGLHQGHHGKTGLSEGPRR